MIPAIVFSRDRACQLDGLLSTLPDVFSPVQVLFTASTMRLADGYDACMIYHPSTVFVSETAFGSNVRALLETPAVDASGLVCFFTDDDLVLGPVDEPAIQAALGRDDVVAFSLRLGGNTTRCYPHDRYQKVPQFEMRDGSFVWSWADADLDFGYPLSLDGHVLRAGDVRDLIDGVSFSNPNELEDALAGRAHLLAARPLLASFMHSVLVGVPANRVNATHPNRHADEHGMSVDALNERFLAGWRIDPSLMPLGRADGAHQEVGYAFRRVP